MRKTLALAFLVACAMPTQAAEFRFEGYADFRAVAPSDQRSWMQGGLGKLRYGDGDSNFQFAEALGEGHLLLTPEILAVAAVRIEPRQRTFLDVTEAYIRYRPVSTNAWRWSIKAGAFFPPFSLENTEIGWTSYWTLTPSAINSWFGQELRTIGAEGTLEWRGEQGTLTASAAAFGWNDPAGVMMAERGWTFDDRPTGLFDHLREPDATVILFGDTPPKRTPIFEEIDRRVGWYAGLSWDDSKLWHAEVEYYDNGANASRDIHEIYAWRTHFWNVGASAHYEEFTAIAQGVTGNTVIAPFAGFVSTTDFSSAYLLLGWERNNWRVALRGDVFDTTNVTTLGSSILGEQGTALTAAVSWLPNDWLRLTGEVLRVNSTRRERIVEGLAPMQDETQFQLSAKFFIDG
ncbi:MAG: hypothetical protein HY243_02480 [Proteobacteria bacterium]|nr:hypothetical protein [Pseudomonadota bacterium]